MPILARPIGLLVYPSVVSMMRRLRQPGHGCGGASEYFNAIRDRDAETAEKWIRRHMVDFGRGYELAHLDWKGVIRDAGIEGEERCE